MQPIDRQKAKHNMTVTGRIVGDYLQRKHEDNRQEKLRQVLVGDFSIFDIEYSTMEARVSSMLIGGREIEVIIIGASSCPHGMRELVHVSSPKSK